jgi:anti-sigma factor RsiW
MRAPTPDPATRDPIDCETAVRRLWDYLDGRLPAWTREEVRAHLTSCALCPPHVEFAREMRDALAASAPPVSDEDETRLRARVRAALGRVAASGETGSEAGAGSAGTEG